MGPDSSVHPHSPQPRDKSSESATCDRADAASQPPRSASLAELPTSDLIDRFAIGVENFDRRVLDLTNPELDTAFRPESGAGRWPARVLLGHLAEAEIVFVHRMRRTVAEDAPLLALFDENACIDCGRLYGTPETGHLHPVGAFVAAIHTMRAWTAPWLRTLDAAHLARRALHPERGEITVRSILEYSTWHLEHHAWFLRKKLDRLRPPPA
ncbi:MAG: DinB family protein [Phycisphaerae bacterium]|nr:DinB family protein [Phycisphaerae bacterium]